MKSRKLFLVLLIFLITFALNDCVIRSIKGNGNVISQERQAENFTGIKVSGFGNINVYQSESYKVTVKIDSNLHDFIETKTENNSLHIEIKSVGINSGINPTEYTIDIYMPELKNIEVSGAANIKIVDGKTADLVLNVSGACKIDAENYEFKNINVALSGASDVKVWAVSTLNYNVSGVGNVRYKGNPALTGTLNGIGSIKPL